MRDGFLEHQDFEQAAMHGHALGIAHAGALTRKIDAGPLREARARRTP